MMPAITSACAGKAATGERMSSRQKNPIAEEYLREQIISIEHIAQLARAGRACYRRYIGVMPAAVLLNMPASLLLRWIADGTLFIYPKRKPTAARPKSAGKKGLPSWCTVGQLVYWQASKQNHTITSIRGGKVYFTPGADYHGFREWCKYSAIGQLQPVHMLEGEQK